jgi:hypothetical protein
VANCRPHAPVRSRGEASPSLRPLTPVGMVCTFGAPTPPSVRVHPSPLGGVLPATPPTHVGEAGLRRTGAALAEGDGLVLHEGCPRGRRRACAAWELPLREGRAGAARGLPLRVGAGLRRMGTVLAWDMADLCRMGADRCRMGPPLLDGADVWGGGKLPLRGGTG